MRTLATLAAILLLLLLCTATRSATINGKVIRPRRGSTGTTISSNDVQKQTPEILVAHSSEKINDLLSLTDSPNVVSKQNNARTSLDQQVDQSEIMWIADLGNIEDALSIMEYEPQKINRKGKRKISAPHKNANVQDTIEFSIENREPIPTVISNTYNDPPSTKPKKTPKYYSNPSQESSIHHSDPRSKPIDPEPIYPALAKSPKPRTKIRPVNSQIPSSPEEAKPENLPPPRPHSSNNQKHRHVDQVTSSPVQFRKKKIRKRLREKVNPENSTDYPRPRSPKRSGSFSGVKTSQESNLENTENVGSNRNPNVSKKDQDQPSKVDPIRGSSNRKLYEHTKGPVGQNPPNERVSPHGNYYSEDKPVFKDEVGAEGLETTPLSLEAYVGHVHGTPRFDGYGSSTYQTGGTASFEDDNPTTFSSSPRKTLGDLKGSKARPSGYGTERSTYEKGGTSGYASLDYENVTPPGSEIYTPLTPSNVKLEARVSTPSRIYQNEKTVPSESYEDHGESTTPSPTFHTVPTVWPTSYPSLGYYAPSASTLSAQRLEDWTPKTKLKRSEDEEDDRRSSDVVAEATNLGDGEESKNRRVYEDTSGEGQKDYRNDQRVHGNDQDERYAGKYEDAQAEGTHGDEKHEGGGKGEFEEGEGAKHEEGHHETDDEKGEKGYESWHKEEKANKGHHDKEQHSNHYDEEDAKKKEHKEDGEYHEEHQKGEHGEKDAEFDEKGEHKKGHNTKGEHFVHKKDEFEKRTEFFDEFHEDDESEKDGEFHHEHESSKGGHEKKGHLDKADHEEHYGKKGKHEKGEHYHKEEGHKQAEGKDDHFEHEDMHGEKKAQEEEKKWAYKKGDDGGDGGKDHKSDR